MKIAIMQPTFCPWIGYFVMIARVDAFVFLDCVQFQKQSWHSRNKIKVNDAPFLISLHLQKAPLQTLIQDMRLCDMKKWKMVLLKTLRQNYQKSQNFKEIYEILEYALFNFESLSQLNIYLIEQFSQILKLKTPFIKASSLALSSQKKEKLVLEICQILKADEYLSPIGAKDYLQKDEARVLFAKANINIEYFAMNHPVYKQQGKQNNFLQSLSIIDLLFNAKNPAQILNKSAYETGGGAKNCLLAKLAV